MTAGVIMRRMPPLASTVLSIVAILGCGTLGAFAGFALVGAAGWSGTGAAIVAAIVGMVVATTAFAGGVALLRRLGWIR